MGLSTLLKNSPKHEKAWGGESSSEVLSGDRQGQRGAYSYFSSLWVDDKEERGIFPDAHTHSC